jgi:hypothetical protein
MIWVNVGGCAVDQASMVVLHAHDETRAKKVSDGIPRGETVLTGDLSRIAQTKALWSTWSARIAGFDANHPQCRCRLPRAETNDGLPRFRHQTLSLAITGFCGEEICARSPSALIITITCRTIRVPYHQRIDPVPRAHRLRRFSCSRLRNDDGSADRRRRRSNWTQRFPSTVPCAEAC